MLMKVRLNKDSALDLTASPGRTAPAPGLAQEMEKTAIPNRDLLADGQFSGSLGDRSSQEIH